MKLYMTFSKKSLVIAVAAALIIIAVGGQIAAARNTVKNGETNALRIEFINSMGYSVNDSAVSAKETAVPDEFSDVYKKYNELQRKAGYDLLEYKGKKVTVYTYAIENSESEFVNIIVCDGVVIGGDVSDVCINGEMKPLLKR